MEKILTRNDIHTDHYLFEEMYRARAKVFKEKLGWDVDVINGMEIDHYDTDYNPTYVISLNEQGKSTASLRILPTIGPTMLENEFSGFFDEPLDIKSPLIWECTRLCTHLDHVQSGADSIAASKQVLSCLYKLCHHNGIEQVMGVYFEKMARVFRLIGWAPKKLAVGTGPYCNIAVGIWDVTSEATVKLIK